MVLPVAVPASVHRAVHLVVLRWVQLQQAAVRQAVPVQRLQVRQPGHLHLAQHKQQQVPGQWVQAVRVVQLQVPVRRRHLVLQIVPVLHLQQVLPQQVVAVPEHHQHLPQAV